MILSSHLRLGFPSSLFPSRFPTKILYAFLMYPVHAPCPAHLVLLHLITLTIFGEVYKLRSSSLHGLLHLATISSLLGPNILLRTLLSNTLNLCPSLSVIDLVS